MQHKSPALAEQHRMQAVDDRARVIQELVQVVRQMSHEVANAVGVPLGVLELLREHPGLGQVERDQIDLAIARLTTLAAEIRTRHAEVRRLDLADESPH
jgi:hypothetical protein